MAIYMPPLCRKKKVLDRYNPDTFRVISYIAEESHPKHDKFEEGNTPSEWRRKWLENEGLALPDIYNRKTEVLPHPAPDFRMNKPHPGSCGFLRHNVRLLNEPICSVYTDIPQDDSQYWWPSRISKDPLMIPPRTNNTIYRSDFLDHEEKPATFGSKRHTSNPNKEPALGTAPVNFLRPKDGSQRLYKENISYEHQYDCRKDNNYPIRARRHGSFVWDPIPADASKKFVSHYSVITAEEGARRQEVIEAEKLADEASKLLENTNAEEPSQVCEPAETQEVPVDSEPMKAENKSPAQSGHASPKQVSSRKSSSSSQKKAGSRKGSGSNGEKSVNKCNDVQKSDSTEKCANEENKMATSTNEGQKTQASEE